MFGRCPRVVVAMLTAFACVPAVAEAAPTIGLTKTVPETARYGAEIPVTLTASSGTGQPTGYNLSFRDVLPAGVAYVAGSAEPAPEVRADQPGAGQTTLIWSNLSDLAADATFSLSFRVSASQAIFEVGDLVSDSASAFVNSDPRVVPAFSAAGLPVPGTSTGEAAATGQTQLSAIDVDKSGPAALLRGVHDHQYEYTLTTRNNDVRGVTGVSVEDFLPAGLEFLGCGGPGADATTSAPTNPGSAEEYPGSGPIVVPTVAGCLTPTEVETVSTDPDGAGDLPAGIYTRVRWTLPDLAASAVATISYRAAVPIRANTVLWAGATPSVGGGRHAANLDNNTGAETFDEQPVANRVIARATYPRTGGPVAVSDAETHRATAEDLVLAKSSSSPALVVGQITTWTLTATASEYRYVDDVRVTDIVPDGLCPLDATNRESDATADCDQTAAPDPSSAPSRPYTAIGERADGSWQLSFTKATVPGFVRLQPNQSAYVSFQTRTRVNYQEDSTDALPVGASDDVLNTASVLGADFARCAGLPADCTGVGAGAQIFHQEPDGTDDADAASSGQASTGPEIEKTTAAPVAGACSGAVYSKAVLRYVAGDRVCFKLRVTFPSATATATRPLVDFLPPNVAYDATAPPVAGPGNTLGGTTFDASDAASGILRWALGTVPQTTPGKVFEVVFAGRLTGPAAYADGAVTGNLMKFTSLNTEGRAFPLRDRVTLEQSVPLTLRKGVRSVNGAPGAGNPPNTDGSTVAGGDAVVYRVDLANAAEDPVSAGEVWDLLPAGIGCADITGISDSGACAAAGGGTSRIVWTGIGVPAAVSGTAGTKTLTYQLTVPATLRPGTALPNRAGVRSYQTTSNTNDPFTYVPADNIDASVSPATTNVTAADDPSTVTTRAPTLAKSHTTSVTESGNSAAAATIGETITYTVTATIPRNATLASGATLSDPVSSRLALVPGSESASVVDGPDTATASVAGATVSATLPAGYATGATDAILTLTFEAVVRDDPANVRGGAAVPNTATLSIPGLTAIAASSPTTIVEPQVGLTKVDDAGGARVAPDQVVQYTVTVSNPSGTSVSTAHDATVVDTVPAGLTPLKAGTATAAADGELVSVGGGTWDAGARTITWAPTLTPGASGALVYRARVDNPLTGGSTLTNSAVLRSSSLPGTVTGEPSTGSSYTRTATDTVRVGTATIAKAITTPASGKATVGQVVRYQLDVTIPPSTQLYDTTVRDALPDSLTPVGYVSATCLGGCSPDIVPTTFAPTTTGATGPTQLAWFLGDLAPAAAARVVRLVYDARVLSTRRGTATKVVDGTTAVNTATVQSNRTDLVSGTPATAPASGQDSLSDSRTLTVVEPKLTVDKAVAGQLGDADARVAVPGQTLTYTVTVTNTGTTPAYDAVVTDTPDTELTGITPVTGAAAVTDPWSAADPDLTWTLTGPIAPGATVTLTYTATLAASGTLDPDEPAVNTVDVPAYFGLAPGDRGPEARAYDDVTPDAVTVTIDLPKLSTVKTTGAGSAAPYPDSASARIGEAFGWRVAITNTAGTARAVGVDAVDVLPAGWSYVAGSARLASPALTPATAVEPAVTGAAGGDTLRWTDASALEPGETLLVTFQARPSPASATAPGLGAGNPHVNTAYGTASDTSGATASAEGAYRSLNDTAQAILTAPALTVTKTPDGAAATAGTASAFTITVANTGTAPATDVDVTDDLPAGLAYTAATATASPATGFSETSVGPGATTGTTRIRWRIASIPAGAAVAITLPVAVPASVDPGVLTNNATATSAERPDLLPGDSGSLTVGASADVKVTKTADPASVVPGSLLTYTLVAENTGPSDARRVVLTDPLPAGTTFVSATPAEGSTTCTVTGRTVTCAAGVLPPGATRTVSLVVRVARTQVDPLVNTATVTTTTTDPVPANNTAAVSTPVVPAADLRVTKQASRTNVLEGGSVDYTLTVTNTGPSAARAVRLVDVLPAGLDFVDSSPGGPTCAPAANTDGTTQVTCTLGDVPDGETRNVVLTARVVVGSIGPRRNVVTGESTTPDPNLDDNTAVADIIAGPAADLRVVKTAAPTVAAGGELTYLVRTTNRGPSAAQAAQVTDVLPAGTRFVRATSTQGTCTELSGTVSCAVGTVAVDQVVDVEITVTAPVALADQTLTNTAAVVADNGDPEPADNTSSASTTVGPSADLGLTKTGPVRAAPGQALTYALVVVNRGPSAATAVTLEDTLPAGLAFVSAAPAQGTCTGAGQRVSCALGDLAATGTTQVLVTARVADGLPPQSLTNTAAVSAAEPDPAPADNMAAAATEVVPVAAAPGSSDVRIVKTASTTRPAVGGRVRYTLTATNDGPATAREVRVTDALPAALELVGTRSTQGRCTGTRAIVCRVGDLRVGDRVVITIDTTIRRPGAVRNNASVTAANAESDPTDNGAVAGVRAVSRAARVTVTKRADHRRARPGQLVRWTMTVRNQSSAPALSVVVCDRIPEALSLVAAGGGTLKDGQVCWRRGTLAARGTWTMTVRTRLLRGTTTRRVTNAATARAANAPRVSGRAVVAVDLGGVRARRESGVTG